VAASRDHSAGTYRRRRLVFGWNASSKLDATQQSVAAQLKTTEQAVQQDVSSLKDRLAQDEKANTDRRATSMLRPRNSRLRKVS